MTRFEPMPLPRGAYLWGIWDHKNGRYATYAGTELWWSAKRAAKHACRVLNREEEGE